MPRKKKEVEAEPAVINDAEEKAFQEEAAEGVEAPEVEEEVTEEVEEEPEEEPEEEVEE